MRLHLFSRDWFFAAWLSMQPPAQRMVTVLEQKIPVPERLIVQQDAEALRHEILVFDLRFRCRVNIRQLPRLR